MSTYQGYTETDEQIQRRWERWTKQAEEIEAAQAEQTKQQTPNVWMAATEES